MDQINGKEMVEKDENCILDQFQSVLKIVQTKLLFVNNVNDAVIIDDDSNASAVLFRQCNTETWNYYSTAREETDKFLKSIKLNHIYQYNDWNTIEYVIKHDPNNISSNTASFSISYIMSNTWLRFLVKLKRI